MIKIVLLFLICSVANTADRDIICATSTCTPDFTPVNQYEKIYYTSIDAGINFVDNIFVDTVLGQNPRSLRYYFEANSKASAPNLSIKLQSKSSEFNAGDTVVLMDYVNNLNTNLNGYSGTVGKSASEICGEKMLLGGSLGYGDLAKAEYQAKRIENSSLPVNKCIAADVDFLQKNTFTCDAGYTELDSLSPQVTVRRYKGKTKCLGVGFKDVCVQKTVEITCTWGLKYTSPVSVAGQFSTNSAETIQKKFIMPEEEWNLKATTPEMKSYLCQNLTKGAASEVDSLNIVSNGDFTLDAAGWTLGNNTKVVNSKIKLGTGPELVIEDKKFLNVGGQRGYSFHLGYTNTTTAGIKNYTYQVMSKLSNVSCVGQVCTVLTAYSTPEYKINTDGDPYIIVAKIKVSNPRGEYNIYDIKYKLELTGSNTYLKYSSDSSVIDNGDFITQQYGTGTSTAENANGINITTTTTSYSCPARPTVATAYAAYPTLYVNNYNSGTATYTCQNNQYLGMYYSGGDYNANYGTKCNCVGASLYYYNLAPSITASMAPESAGFAKQTLQTEANEYYRVTATGYTATEDAFMTSGDARVYDFSELAPIDYALGQDGPLIVESGQTVTIPNGSVKNYSSVEVKSGGILKIGDGIAITTLIVKNDIIVNGEIQGNSGKSIGNVSASYTDPDFKTYTISYPLRNGGKGGRGGETSVPERLYNWGGPQSSGNGGGGAPWVRWHNGRAASASCGGVGGTDGGTSNGSGGCIYGNPGTNSSNGGGGGGARGALGQALVLIAQNVQGDGLINVSGQNGGRGGNGGGYGYSFGSGGGGGAGGSGGALFVKSKTMNVKYQVRGGSGGAGGNPASPYGGLAGFSGDSGESGANGTYSFEKIQYLGRYLFNEMSIVDTTKKNEFANYFPVIPSLAGNLPRKKYYVDYVFKAQSNRSVIELTTQYLNTPVYFDTVVVKKISPNAGPPVRAPKSVANQGGNYQGVGGNIGYFELKSDPITIPTTVGYDPETFDLITGSSWKVQFAEIGGECPVFTVLTKKNYLTSIISYDQNDDLCDDIKLDQDPNNTINWKNIGFDRKQEFGTEQLNCSMTNCPVNNVVQSFSKSLDTINTSMGLSGTQQGEGLFLLYDILGSSSVSNLIGSTGIAGSNDLPEYKDNKICAKIQDITTESSSSEFASSPLVNFKKFTWTALKVENTNVVPKVPDNNKKQIYIYKKIDSSVRYLLKQELF